MLKLTNLSDGDFSLNLDGVKIGFNGWKDVSDISSLVLYNDNVEVVILYSKDAEKVYGWLTPDECYDDSDFSHYQD